MFDVAIIGASTRARGPLCCAHEPVCGSSSMTSLHREPDVACVETSMLALADICPEWACTGRSPVQLPLPRVRFFDVAQARQARPIRSSIRSAAIGTSIAGVFALRSWNAPSLPARHFARTGFQERSARDAASWLVAYPNGADHPDFWSSRRAEVEGRQWSLVRRQFADRLVAHVGWFRARPGHALKLDRRLAIGAAECGWWYACPSGDGCLQLAVVCRPQNKGAQDVLRTVASQTAELAVLAGLRIIPVADHGSRSLDENAVGGSRLDARRRFRAGARSAVRPRRAACAGRRRSGGHGGVFQRASPRGNIAFPRRAMSSDLLINPFAPAVRSMPQPRLRRHQISGNARSVPGSAVPRETLAAVGKIFRCAVLSGKRTPAFSIVSALA